MLPKMKHPSYDLIIPSSKKTYKFRPYTVREQKILLMLQDSSSPDELINSITELIESCSLNENFSAKNLTYFDIEYIFLKLRSKSVDNISKVSFRCNNYVDNEPCNTVNQIEIDLDTIEVDMSSAKQKEINLVGDVTIKLNYPNIKSAKYIEEYNINRNVNSLFSAIYEDVESVYDEEKIYEDYSFEDLKSFLESLDLESFKKILDFYLNTPRLTKEVNFVCRKCGYNENVVLVGISDFFD